MVYTLWLRLWPSLIKLIIKMVGFLFDSFLYIYIISATLQTVFLYTFSVTYAKHFDTTGDPLNFPCFLIFANLIQRSIGYFRETTISVPINIEILFEFLFCWSNNFSFCAGDTKSLKAFHYKTKLLFIMSVRTCFLEIILLAGTCQKTQLLSVYWDFQNDL